MNIIIKVRKKICETKCTKRCWKNVSEACFMRRKGIVKEMRKKIINKEAIKRISN